MLTPSKEDLAGLSHLLPPAALELIRVVGWEATYKLISHYPGTHFPVGKNKTKAGKILHAALSEVVGEKNAERISLAYRTQRNVWIPKCQGAVQELRNRLIRRQFDELISQTPPMPAYLAARNLALEHYLSERHIWRILNEVDRTPEESKPQMPLF